jgi:hypothetical protein
MGNRECDYGYIRVIDPEIPFIGGKMSDKPTIGTVILQKRIDVLQRIKNRLDKDIEKQTARIKEVQEKKND